MAKFSDETVGAVLRGTRAILPYAWPHKRELRVGVRVLSDEETDACRLQGQVLVREWAKARGYDPTTVVDIDPEIFQRMTQREVIFAAFYDVETIASPKPERFFSTPHEVRSLTTPEVHSLFELYTQHQAVIMPLRLGEEEEVSALEEALGKGQHGSEFLGAYDRSTLLRLLLSLVRRRST